MRVDIELDDETVSRVLTLLGGDAAALADPAVAGRALAEVVNTGLLMLADEVENPSGGDGSAARAAEQQISDLTERVSAAESDRDAAVARAAAPAAPPPIPLPGEVLPPAVPVSVREAEEIMLSLASTPRVDAGTMDERGVVQRAWFPQDDTWSEVDRLSEAFHDIDYYAYLIKDRVRSDPRLRAFVANRRLPTNELIDEFMCAAPLDDILVTANIKGRPWYFRVDRSQVIILGKLVGKPTPASK